MKRGVAALCAFVLLVTPMSGCFAIERREKASVETDGRLSELIEKLKEAMNKGNFTNMTYLLLLAGAVAVVGGAAAGTLALVLKHVKLIERGVFIVSRGYERKGLDGIVSPRIEYLMPFVLWHYTKTRLLFKPSKTLIVDPSLSRIRVLDGKQIGIILGFAGFYIHVPKATAYSKEGFTYFIGFAYRVLAIDLPDIPTPAKRGFTL